LRLADVIIRILHFSGKHGIDIEQAVREKMLYNESRPMKHGGKKL
jgi:NTP pyrophosphatase (non-canonical NTP hydrolase)